MSLAQQQQRDVVEAAAVQIRLSGRVQGVGMRPAIWRLARELDLQGQVCNQGSDVLIDVHNGPVAAQRLLDCLRSGLPPLARIDQITQASLHVSTFDAGAGFRIMPSEAGEKADNCLPDAITCAECLDEIRNPSSRRYRYPFTNCTHCGPRLSIQMAVPWDRDRTSMAAFAMCPTCEAEYQDPTDRRFHAQPIACPDCGPQLRLVDAGSIDIEHTAIDAIAAAATLIADGAILAIKGLGGFHLACDAGNETAVSRLRAAKRREAKPFALMARDSDMVAACCELDAASAAALADASGPIILLPRRVDAPALAEGVAPGLNSLGMMLPTTPLHHLLLDDLKRPLVMTSGNLSAAPPCTENDQALEQLATVADAFLLHDRAIINRLDDSILRPMAGQLRVLRRARGLAPEPIALPEGLGVEQPVLAMGGDLKASFCLLGNEGAVLGQHIGDLEQAANLDDYERAIERYQALFRFEPETIAVDLHPEYLSRKRGMQLADERHLQLEEVQHHHAHIAACLADNAIPLNTPRVLGIALDGLGLGDDGQLWGGEFLMADYRDYRRLGSLQAIPLPGGDRAMREPWRNTYAHLTTAMNWAEVQVDFADLELIQSLQTKPLGSLDTMLTGSLNCPLSSSAGRWFDAVAAALGQCRQWQDYEAQAAMRLEALADPQAMQESEDFYCFTITEDVIARLNPAPMWTALLGDLQAGLSLAVIAARFHGGLAAGLVAMAERFMHRESISQVALSGGVFQNRLLFEAVHSGLESLGLQVLSHHRVPANDGGLALGQAMIAAARQAQAVRRIS